MPAAAKKHTPKPKEHVKGLESNEALDKILSQFAEKRSQQLLNDTTLLVKETPKPDLGSKAARRARRKELQARSGVVAQQNSGELDENQDICLKCNNFTCRLMHWLPASNAEGEYECQLCNTSGLAASGVWHCLQCNWNAHVSCYSRRKESNDLLERMVVPPSSLVTEADCPKPSLAWDPLSLTGPHMAIGAGAGLRNIGEVALD